MNQPSLCAAAEPHEHWTDPGRAGYAGLTAVMAAHCHPMRGIHLEGCCTEDCRGCMPRLADQGLVVCRACRLRMADRVRELPRLYEDLLTPTRGASSSEVAPSSGVSSAVGDEARNARSAIRRLLVTWCQTISHDRGVPAPSDTVQAMADRLSRFLDVLLADPAHADQLVHDVDVAATEARRRAYPAPPRGDFIGTCPIKGPEQEMCGGPVRATLDSWDEAGWAMCGTCKTKAVLPWWLDQMQPQTPEWMIMTDVRWHLVLHCGRQVPEATVRSWAKSEELPSRVDPDTGRVQYRVEEARALCVLARRRGRPRVLEPA